MKKYLFAIIILGLNLSFAEDAADFKKNLIASCVASGNAQLSCECAITGFEKELSPEAWEAFLTSTNPKLITELGKDKEKADKLLALLEGAEEQMKKITTDCDAGK